jgi:hypothetical protein
MNKYTWFLLYMVFMLLVTLQYVILRSQFSPICAVSFTMLFVGFAAVFAFIDWYNNS